MGTSLTPLPALQAAAAAAQTADWLAQHAFESEEELQRVAHLLRWDGADAGGHPMLHIAIGAAVNECRTAPAAMVFANAIVTQLQVCSAARSWEVGRSIGYAW